MARPNVELVHHRTAHLNDLNGTVTDCPPIGCAVATVLLAIVLGIALGWGLQASATPEERTLRIEAGR